MPDTNTDVMDSSPGVYRSDMGDTNDNVMDARGGRGGQDTGSYGAALHHYRTVDSVVIPKEYFEKINSQERAPRAVLRTIFGNPFPMYVLHRVTCWAHQQAKCQRTDG